MGCCGGDEGHGGNEEGHGSKEQGKSGWVQMMAIGLILLLVAAIALKAWL